MSLTLRTLAITILIAFALYFTYGQFSLHWMAVLPVIFALSICSLPSVPLLKRRESGLALISILFFLVISAMSLLPSLDVLRSIIVDVSNPTYLPTMRLLFGIAAFFVIGLYVAAKFGRERLQLVLFSGAVASLIICFGFIIPTSPNPQIDVWTVHEEGAQAFIDFKNPYTHEYKNIYAEELRPILTPGGVTYSYLPGTFLWMAPWKALDLDTRYSQLLTRLITSVLLFLIAWRTRKRLDFLTYVPTLLWLSFPLNTFFIVRAWNDDISLMCYALAAWALVTRRPWALFLACNFLLVLKHHAIFFVPMLIWFAWRLFGQRLWAVILKSVCGAAVILGAYLIADWRNFLGSLYGLTFLKFPGVTHVFPDRRDPFSLMNYLHLFVGYKNSWFFVLVILAIAVQIFRKLSKVPMVAPFLRGLAAMAFGLFIFSPVAFANYYGFAWGLLVIAFASSLNSAATREPTEPSWEFKTDWWVISYVASRAIILFGFSNLILETRYFHGVSDLIAANRWPYADFNFNFLPFALIPTEAPKLLQDLGALPGFLTYHTLFLLTVLVFDIILAKSVFEKFRNGRLDRGALAVFVFGPLFLAPLYLASATVVTIVFTLWIMALLRSSGLAKWSRERLRRRPQHFYLGIFMAIATVGFAVILASEFLEIDLDYNALASPTGFLIWAVAFMPLLSWHSKFRARPWAFRAFATCFLLALALTFYLLSMIEAVADQKSGFTGLVLLRNILICALTLLFAFQLYPPRALAE